MGKERGLFTKADEQKLVHQLAALDNLPLKIQDCKYEHRRILNRYIGHIFALLDRMGENFLKSNLSVGEMVDVGGTCVVSKIAGNGSFRDTIVFSIVSPPNCSGVLMLERADDTYSGYPIKFIANGATFVDMLRYCGQATQHILVSS